MTPPPFHHGNLRAALLEEARRTLRDGSVEDLSLRELARRAGVSHGAPRSHFADRQALLDALAEQGFEHLTRQLADAGAAHPDDLTGRLRAVARAYVGFAVTDPGLMDLMFSTKGTGAPQHVQAAAGRLFSTFASLFEEDLRAGRIAGSDPERTRLLFVAVLQGIASLISSRRIAPAQGDLLVDDAVALLVTGAGPEDPHR